MRHFKCLLPLLLLCNLLNAQPTDVAGSFAYNSIPASPQATSMTKYGGIPLNLSTGGPNYSIPLFKSKISNQLELDLSLHYNTNGVRVQELAGPVGLSWSFFSGGVISRIINDQPDELSTDLANPLTISTAAQRNIEYFEDNPLKRLIHFASAPFYDIQPDLFSYNFFGRTGQFFLDSSKPYFIDYEDLKIEMDFSSLAPWAFKVTDQYGNIFYFGGPNATEKTNVQNSAVTLAGAAPGWNTGTQNTTAWFLKKIETPQQDIVTFDYTVSNYSVQSEQNNEFINQNIIDWGPSTTTPCECPPPIIKSTQVRSTSGFDINSIVVNNTLRADFTYDSNPDLIGANIISKISIKDLQTSEITKIIDFSYLIPAYSKRPLLNNLAICDANGATCDSFIFHYNQPELLPKRNDIGKEDFYGYFNNGLSDRKVNCSTSTVGILTKVVYPTGGSDDISYGCSQRTDIVDVKVGEVGTYFYGFGYGDHSMVTHTKEFVTIPGMLDVRIVGEAFWHSYPGLPPADPDENMHQIFITVENKRTHQKGPDLMRIQAEEMDFSSIINYIPGDTLLLTMVSCGDRVEGYMALEYKKNVPTAVTSYYGAAKVTSVNTYDPISQKTKIKKYVYEHKNQPGVSSGISLNNIYTDKTYYYKQPCTWTAWADSWRTCQYNLKTNYSVFDLYSYMPSSYLYSSVLEYDGVNGEGGLTEHIFDVRIPGRPFVQYPNNIGVPSTYNDDFEAPYSLFGGKITNEIVTNLYKNFNGSFQPLQLEKRWFSQKQNIKEKLGYAVNLVDPGHPAAPGQTLTLKGDVKQYTYRSAWTTLDSVSTTKYDDNGVPMYSSTAYTYGNIDHTEPNIVQNINGNGNETMLINLFPKDYIANSDYIATMQNGHMNKYPIEQITMKKKDGYFYITSANFNEYLSTNPSLLSKQYRLELESAVYIGDFKLSNRAIASGLTNYTKLVAVKDSRYNNFDQHLLYDGKFNSTETLNNKGVKNSFIWAHDGALMIASVTNASFSDVAYTSFEDDNQKGNWAYSGTINNEVTSDDLAPTGNYVLNLDAGKSITKGNLDPSKKYVVSFYYKGAMYPTVSNEISNNTHGQANTYSRYEAIITNTTNVSISFGGGVTKIDEVRLYPFNSTMETFSYKPGVGLISQCSDDGNIKQYRYDSKGRLIAEKDRNGNILKKYSYTVQGAQ